MEEQEWQPVRIAPIKLNGCADTMDADELAEYAKDVGKIIYVRPDRLIDPHCGGKMYRIRELDEERLDGGWEGHHYICEHQILTD